MGRKIRTLVPILESQLQPREIPNKVIRDAHDKSKMSSKAYYDQHHGAKTPLHNISPGDQVALESDQTSKWSVPGTVVAADQSNRTYLVNTPSGVFRRNRQQLLKTTSASPTSTAENVLPEPSDEQDNNENILAPNNRCHRFPSLVFTTTTKYQVTKRIKLLRNQPVSGRKSDSKNYSSTT